MKYTQFNKCSKFYMYNQRLDLPNTHRIAVPANTLRGNAHIVVIMKGTTVLENAIAVFKFPI